MVQRQIPAGGELPVWRSLLYVPTHVEKFVASAATRGADAIILDLEDSVPPDQKAYARTLVQSAAERVAQGGADVVVRINRPLALAIRDIEAAVGPGVSALSLPKVESAAHVQLLDEAVAEVEAEHGLSVGRTRFIVLIESALGLSAMLEIARSSPRVVAMTLGGEDFALDLGMEACDETLLLPKQQLIQACAAARIMPLGIIGAIAGFDDSEAYLALARRSRRFGYVGSSCIHPRQVPLLNEAFTASAEETAHAARVVEQATEADRAGRGAFAVDGKMIDAPIVARARRLLARHAAIEARAAKRRGPAT
jgi:citrate lyase subunit beta/citryl-CoA lyase